MLPPFKFYKANSGAMLKGPDLRGGGDIGPNCLGNIRLSFFFFLVFQVSIISSFLITWKMITNSSTIMISFSPKTPYSAILRPFMCSKQQDVEQLLLNKGVCLTSANSGAERDL